MKHRLKIEKAYADAVLEGSKTFEIRYDDRGYQKGDMVEFNVIDNNDEINHPLNNKEFEITYVLHGWGLKDSWCVFSIKENNNETVSWRDQMKEHFREAAKIGGDVFRLHEIEAILDGEVLE